MPRRAALVLDICRTDRTFELADRPDRRGGTQRVWWGKCIHCNGRLVVGLDGRTSKRVTIEHIVPRTHGGTDDLDNVALACARCNGAKGRRLDLRPAQDPDLQAMITRLKRRRAERWRAPDDAPM